MSDQAKSTEADHVSPSSARHTRRFVWIARVVSLLIALFALEIGLRIHTHLRTRDAFEEIPENPADAPPGEPTRFINLIYRVPGDQVYRLRPNLNVLSQGTHYRTNDHGFRDGPWHLDATSRTLRVLCVGDSTLAGYGVEPPLIYVNRLERRLDAMLGPEWDVDCFNTGIPGYNTAQQAALCDELVDIVKPHMMLVQFDPNDLNLNLALLQSDWLSLNTLYLARLPALLKGRLLTDRQAHHLEVEALPGYRHLHGWASVERGYEQLREIARQRGIPLLVVLPYWGDTFDEDDSQTRGNMPRLLRRLGVPWVETRPTAAMVAAELGLKTEELLIDPPEDMHPTWDGHQAMARAIAPDAFRMLARGRLNDARIDATVAALRRHARPGLAEGLHAAENWGGEPVHWTRGDASLELARPAGATRATVRYLIGHRDLETSAPLWVAFGIDGAPWQRREHVAGGYCELPLDLPDAPPSATSPTLRVAVGRAFMENPNGPGRELGVALYPVRWSSVNCNEGGNEDND